MKCPLIVLVLILISLVGPAVAQAPQGSEIFVTESASWQFVNASPGTTIWPVPEGWEQPSFDDSGWATGVGPLGQVFSFCADPCFPQTPAASTSVRWDRFHDPYLRTRFQLPARQELVLWLALDDEIEALYLNGLELTLPDWTQLADPQPFAVRWETRLIIPAQVTAQGDNVLAIRLRDAGQMASTGFACVVTANTVYRLNTAMPPEYELLPACSDPCLSLVGVRSHLAGPQTVSEIGNVEVTNLRVEPLAPALNQTVRVLADVINHGRLEAQLRLRWSAENPATGSAIDWSTTSTLRLPANMSDRMTVEVNWTPRDNGPTDLIVEAENLTYAENEQDNVALGFVVVGAPPVDLEVTDVTLDAWPGLETEVVFSVLNVGALETRLTSMGTDPTPGTNLRNGWVVPIAGPTQPPGSSVLGPVPGVGPTLTAGRTHGVRFAVRIPLSGPGLENLPAFGTGPGLAAAVPVFLTAEGLVASPPNPTGTFVGTLDLNLYAGPPPSVTVRVIESANSTNPGQPIAGAALQFREIPDRPVTDANGEVVVRAFPGGLGIFAYKLGFRAATFQALIMAGQNTITIELEEGETLAVQEITAMPLTSAQAIARGIDPNQLANNVIWDFVVRLRIENTTPGAPPPPPVYFTFSNVSVPMPGSSPRRSITRGYCGCSGPGAPRPRGSGGRSRIGMVVTATTFPAGHTTYTWVIIGGEVRALRQFFEVSMIVENRALASPPEDVQLRNLTAELMPPLGLGVPDLNGQPQSLTRSLPDLSAGEAHQEFWVLRGDIEGEWTIRGRAQADLFAFQSDTGFDLSVDAESPPVNVALPQLRLSFGTPPALTAGADFSFVVNVANTGVIPAGLVRVIVDPDTLRNCEVSPNPQPLGTEFVHDPVLGRNVLLAELGDIPVGARDSAAFSLRSHVSGQVVEVRTSVAARGDLRRGVNVARHLPGHRAYSSLPPRSFLETTLNNVPTPQGLRLVSRGDQLGLRVSTEDPALAGVLVIPLVSFLNTSNPGPFLISDPATGLNLQHYVNLGALLGQGQASVLAPDPTRPGWYASSTQVSAWQPGLQGVSAIAQAVLLDASTLALIETTNAVEIVILD